MKEARRKNDRPPEYLLNKLGTRLSSHDYLNLESHHHQKFVVLIITFFCYYFFSAAKIVHCVGINKLFLAFFTKNFILFTFCIKIGPFFSKV